jgi:predicted AAA+ superfamily ATPase
MTYIRRVVDEELDELMPSLPALALEGARGVGKTETALQRAATAYRLDDPAERALAEADPWRLASGKPPVLIDEWQRVPETWDAVRRAVDAGAPPGSFLLTGSVTPSASPTHSGAGRIVSVRLRPMTLAERGLAQPSVSLVALLEGVRPAVSGSTTLGLEDYATEIVRSGFPGIRPLRGRALRSQLDTYLQRLMEHDIEEAGRHVRNPGTLRRWMTAYAAATATTASYETIRDAATSGQGEKPARTTTQPYRDALERLWIVEPLPAWSPTRNRIARLSAPPKHHLADPALAASLLGIDAAGLLAGQPVGPPGLRTTPLLGALFESLVTLTLRVFAQAAEARVSHLRTKSGDREIDLIVERADGRVLAIEVKLGRTVGDADVRHLHWLTGVVGDDVIDRVVVTTGSDAFRRSDGVLVVPAALLGP